MRMTFGKYGPGKSGRHPRGVDVTFINSGYLRWVAEQDFMDESGRWDLLFAIQDELKYRDLNNCHFDDDKVVL